MKIKFGSSSTRNFVQFTTNQTGIPEPILAIGSPNSTTKWWRSGTPEHFYFDGSTARISINPSNTTGKEVLVVPGLVGTTKITKLSQPLSSGTRFILGIKFPGTIEHIDGTSPFNGITGLKGICIIPRGVRYISYRAFELSPLTTIYIPKNLTSLDVGAFIACSLQNIYYEGTESEFKNILSGANSYGHTGIEGLKEYLPDLNIYYNTYQNPDLRRSNFW